MIEMIQFAQDNHRDLLILGLFITLWLIAANLAFGTEQLKTRVTTIEQQLAPPDSASPTGPADATVSTQSDTPAT